MNENCSQYFYDFECFNNEPYCIFFHELCKNIPFCSKKCRVEHLIVRSETLFELNVKLTEQNNSLIEKISKAKEVLK